MKQLNVINQLFRTANEETWNTSTRFLKKFAAILTMLSLSANIFAQTRVVAYIPTWINFPGIVNTADLTKVTHLNVAFANPNTSGALTGVSAGNITTVVNAAHAKNVKVLISIGGAGASASTYRTLLANSSSSSSFVTKLVQYTVDNNLDGIDVDIEGDVLDGSNVTSSQYQTFVTQLATALHAKNKLMTSALATWFGSYVSNTAAAQFDFINVMSYDAAIPGSGDGAGPHSSYQQAVNDNSYWRSKGVPTSKLTVGLPFYGYGWGSYAQSGNDEIAYSTIVSKYAGAENNDVVGSGSNAIYYNGIPTIKKKTEFALTNASGVMIWELAEDAAGAKSLLNAINEVINGTTPPNQAPTASITSPSNNASFIAPASITISANAADVDGTVSKVEFYNGATLLGSDVTSPYTFNWTNVNAGTYSLSARATDNAGATTSSYTVTVVITTAQVIQSPYGGSPQLIPGTIEAEKYDLGGQGVAYNETTKANQGGAFRTTEAVDVESFSGGYDVGYIATDEWMEYTVNVTSGTYKIEANVAAIAAGKTFRLELDGAMIANMSVPNTGAWSTFQLTTVNNVVLTSGQKVLRIYATSTDFNIDKISFSAVTTNPNVAPTITLTAPINNASYNAPATIVIAANASDVDGTVSKVDFYSGSTLLYTDDSVPYNYSWTNVAAGNYTITAKATDNSGASTSSSATILVNTVVVTNQPPTISLTSPANNSSSNAPATLMIAATAADADGTVSKVEFYNGSTLIGTDATSPCTYSWTNVAAGSYILTAKATDNSGASTTSSATTVAVNAVTNTCSSIAPYVENGNYSAASKVKNANNQYQCKPYPYSGWCNGASWAYGPGTGAYWTDAWTLVGSCGAARSADDASTHASMMISNSPNPFVTTTDIQVIVSEAGDVSVLVYNKAGQIVGTVIDGYLTAGTHTFTFDASALKSDLYLVKYHSANGVSTQKIVKVQ